MSTFRRIPEGAASPDNLANAIADMHDCLHAIAEQARKDREIADDREALRRERHEAIKTSLDDIGCRLGNVEQWQATLAKSFGMRSPEDARPQRRLLGLHYTTILGWIVALIIGLATGPVGYFILLKMLPAAIHAALTVPA